MSGAVGFAGVFGWASNRAAAHARWYRRVELQILKLAPRCPTEVTPAQWAQCLLHTWNLHCNFGHWSYFPHDQREPFIAEFEERLNGPVNLGTIDWIWDDYSRRVPRAASYLRYRPTTLQMLEDAELVPGADSLDRWLEELKVREQER